MKNLLLLCLLAVLASCATTRPLSSRLADAQNTKSYSHPASADSATGTRAEPGSPADFIRRIFQGHTPVVQLGLEAAPDSLPSVHVVKSPQKPTKKRRFLGLLPAKKPIGALESQIEIAQNATQMPRKCKRCTFNVVAGNQTVAGKKAQIAAGPGATASIIAKKAGPAQVASDSSTQNALTGGGNLAAVQGDGNRLEQKASTPPAKSLLQKIWDDFKPVLLIVGGVLGLGAIAFTLLNTPAGPWLVALFKRRKTLTNQV